MPIITITNAVITAYCIASSTHNKCADNKHYPTPHHTIAIGDRSTIPIGSSIVYNGVTYCAEDRMNHRYDGTHRFDIFVNSLKEAKEFGIKHNQTIIIYN